MSRNKDRFKPKKRQLAPDDIKFPNHIVHYILEELKAHNSVNIDPDWLIFEKDQDAEFRPVGLERIIPDRSHIQSPHDAEMVQGESYKPKNRDLK